MCRSPLSLFNCSRLQWTILYSVSFDLHNTPKRRLGCYPHLAEKALKTQEGKLIAKSHTEN